MLSKKQLEDAVRCKGINCHTDCTWKDCYNLDEYTAMNIVAQTALAYRAILERLEWSHNYEGYDTAYCRVCHNDKGDGHKPDCELAALLKEE